MKKRLIISILLTIAAMIATYKLWHHAPVLIFISIMILSFLLSYKITDYIADFKTVKNNSRTDIVFLLIFFILLCIPASHISKAQKAKGENRYLATKPLFIDKNKFNFDFGKEYNEWFNDRFAYRQNLIKLDIILKCNINANYCGNEKAIYYKKKNLLYAQSYFGAAKPTENKQEIFDTYVNNVNRFQKYCDDNNIKLYILLIPRKAEFFDYPIADKRNYESDFAEEVIEYINKNTRTKIIYPKAKMKEANKETPVYFKTDHHWTKKGAYVCYRELMKEIKKDFPSVPVLEEASLEKYHDNRVSEHWDRKLNNGQTFRQLGLPEKYAKKILDTQYLYYTNPNKYKLKTDIQFAPIPESGKNRQDNQFYYPYGLDKKVMVIGNSFAGNLVEFLPYSFKYTARYYDNYRYMHFETYEEVFKQYKPDILIINMYTAYTRALLYLYPNKYRINKV